MMKNVKMKDVNVGEKIFIRSNGTIRQVKIIGFKAKEDFGFDIVDGKDIDRGFSLIYILDLGHGNGIVETSGSDDNILMYRTVSDAVDSQCIKTVYVDNGAFNKAYLSGKPLFVYSSKLAGYRWVDNHPKLIGFSEAKGFEFKDGEVRYIDWQDNYVDIPEGWYGSIEECKAHNTPDVIYYDD